MKYSVAGIVFGCHPPKAAASGISFLAKYPERGWMKPENLRLPGVHFHLPCQRIASPESRRASR